MTTFASIRFRNHSIDKHSSRNFPLKLSFVPFCQGLPGLISMQVAMILLLLSFLECYLKVLGDCNMIFTVGKPQEHRLLLV